jgi:hypothetical protein
MQKCTFSLGSRLSFLTPSLYPPADTWGPLVSSVFPTAPVDPGCDSSAPPLRASDAVEPLQPPSSLSPLNPPSNQALTGLNGLNHHSPPPLLRPPLGAFQRPYKSHPDDPRSTPHLTAPFSSPLPCRKPSPPSSRVLFAPLSSPGRHAAARAPVRPEPSSPCSSLSFAAPPVSFGALERSDAVLR